MPTAKRDWRIRFEYLLWTLQWSRAKSDTQDDSEPPDLRASDTVWKGSSVFPHCALVEATKFESRGIPLKGRSSPKPVFQQQSKFRALPDPHHQRSHKPT